jgi:hypothetical protein
LGEVFAIGWEQPETWTTVRSEFLDELERQTVYCTEIHNTYSTNMPLNVTGFQHVVARDIPASELFLPFPRFEEIAALFELFQRPVRTNQN